MSRLPPATIGDPIWFFNELDLAIRQISAAVQSAIREAYIANRGNIQEVGRAMQALGTALAAQPGVVPEVSGRSLDYLGKLLEHGTAVAPEFSNSQLAQAGISWAAGAAATAFASYVGFSVLAWALGSEVSAALLIGATFYLYPIASMAVIAVAAYGIALGVDWILNNYVNPLFASKKDPLVLDLDGDGIELTTLAGSAAHFDYGQDGFAERTGWVSPDDGILVIDDNANGTVDGAAGLFGSPTQDGFEVLSPLGRMAVASAAVSACTCGRIAA